MKEDERKKAENICARGPVLRDTQPPGTVRYKYTESKFNHFEYLHLVLE